MLVGPGGFPSAWIGDVDSAGAVKVVASAGAVAPADDDGPVREAIRERKPVVRADRSLAVFPMTRKGKVAGVLSLGAAGKDAFTEGDTALLGELAQDVSEALVRLEGMEAAIEDGGRYRLIFESSKDAIVVAEVFPDGRLGLFLQANDAACALLGRTREELLKMSPMELDAHPEEFARNRGFTQKGDTRNFETEVLTKDGRCVSVEISSRLFDMAGKKAGLAVLRDITERKAMERALRESEALYRTIVETTDTGFVIIDREGKVLDANAEYVRLSGHGALDEIRGRNVLEWTADHEKEKNAKAVAKCAREGLIRNLEVDYVDVRGIVTPVEINATVVQRAGVPVIYTLCRDNTERKQTRELLQKEADRTKALLGLYEKTPMEDRELYGRFLETARAMTGSPLGFFHGISEDQETVLLTVWNDKEDTTVSGERFAVAKAENWAGCVCLKRPIVENESRGRPDGMGRALLRRFASVPVEEEGRVLFVLGVGNKPERYNEDDLMQLRLIANDLNRLRMRRRAEEALRRLNAELERRVEARTSELAAVNRELETFAYSVSHDLRAPLRSINGFVKILEDHVGGRLDDQERHYLDTIRDATLQMGTLIDGLLQFSRTGRMDMSMTSVPLAGMVREVVGKHQADTKGRDIRWEVEDLPVVQGDAGMLRQVLANLVDNAVKFTGKVSPAEIRIGSREEAAEHVIFVRDNGVGFDMQYVDKIFGIFQRLHRADEFEGSGVGLASVRRIVERHGGRTWAEGRPGEGATFYFSLPRRKEAKS